MRQFITAVLAICSVSGSCLAQNTPHDPDDDISKPAFGFWENTGWVIDSDEQIPRDIQYASEGSPTRLYIRQKALISIVRSAVDTVISTVDSLWRIDLQFQGQAAQTPDAIATVPKSYTQNFYLPHCGPFGKTEVKGFECVRYPGIYPGIDAWFYSGMCGPKVMIVVQPGASPSAVQMKFTGQDALGIDVEGYLKLLLDNKEFKLPRPVAYQYDSGGDITWVPWWPTYTVNSSTAIVGFSVGTYDPNKPLVFLIGPPPEICGAGGGYNEDGMCWSTYMGGEGDDYAIQSAQDGNDNYYVTGSTSSTITSFPQATGVVTYNGGDAAYIVKFDHSDQILWKSFFGGSAGEYCRPHGCATTTSGGTTHVYLAGRTNSTSLQNQAFNGEHFLNGTSSSFIAKFRTDNGFRTWSTYFEADFISGIANSESGQIFITGRTSPGIWMVNEAYLDDPPPSANSVYWDPATAGGEGFVAMLNTADRLNWFTYLGQEPNGVATSGNRVVVVGRTNNPNLPSAGCPTGSYCEPYTGVFSNVALYEFTGAGEPVWSTYFGETGTVDASVQNDLFGKPVAIDPITGDIAIIGYTFQGSVPMVQGPGWHQSQQIGDNNAFVARFSGGSSRQLTWSSYVPGTSYFDFDCLTTFNGKATLQVVYFDKTGALYLGGSSYRPLGFALAQFGTYYHQASMVSNVDGWVPTFCEPEPMVDGLVMCFDPLYDLRFATYIGGPAFWARSENVHHLLVRNGNDNLYVVGNTTKYMDITSYFPLDDGGGIPSFWPDWAGGESDAFISSFCMEETPVSIPSPVAAGSNAYWVYEDTDHITVAGLANGPQTLRVHDAIGRLVLEQRTTVTGQRTPPIVISGLASGTYLLKTASGTLRFLKP